MASGSPWHYGAVFQLVNHLPQKGTGYRVKRNKWPEGQFWELTTVRPSVVRQIPCGAALAVICLADLLHQSALQDGVHGDAWGLAFAEGELSSRANSQGQSFFMHA